MALRCNFSITTTTTTTPSPHPQRQRQQQHTLPQTTPLLTTKNNGSRPTQKTQSASRKNVNNSPSPPKKPSPNPPLKKLTSSFFLLPKKNSNSNRKQLGARVIKPTKRGSSALKTAQFKKKHSSGMTALTEKSLASRAGHLELLKGGKREKRVELARKALEGEAGKGKKQTK